MLRRNANDALWLAQSAHLKNIPFSPFARRRALQSPSPRSQLGFTVIELLVTMAILAILSTLSMMMSGAVREYSLSTQCVQNLRTSGQSILTAVADGNGKLAFFSNGVNPSIPPWPEYLVTRKYLPTGLQTRCPKTEAKVEIGKSAWGWYAYGMPFPEGPENTTYTNENGTKFVIYLFRPHGAHNISKRILLADSAHATSGTQYFRMRYDDSAFKERYNFCHRGKCNALFADGHIAALTPSEAIELGIEEKRIYPTLPEL